MNEKYKDFQELPKDYTQQDLRNLFVKRNYARFVNAPETDDMVILEQNNDFGAYQFPENTDIESANFELEYLKLDETPSRYLKKRVEAYLKICKEIKDKKPEFPQFIKLSDKRDQFAEELKIEFSSDKKGLHFRYMIEALKNLRLLIETTDLALYNSLIEYFGGKGIVGSYNALFTLKIDYNNKSHQPYTDKIHSAEKRIESIVAKLFSKT